MSRNANGTFLWVALVCKELKNIAKRNVQKRLEELAEFSSGLDGFYERMMLQICDSQDADLCKRILAVVSVVRRPISLSELKALVKEIPAGEDEVLEIIGNCGSFLTVQRRTVSFIHQSAKDFLLNKGYEKIFSVKKEKVHYDIFSQSLQVLSTILGRDICRLEAIGYHIDQVQPIDPDPLAAVRYSCIYWIDHFRDSSPGENAKDDLQKDGLIDHFLHRHFLHWLETLSLLQSISKGIVSIAVLRDLFKVKFRI